mmetsp:Transcript_26181/g.38988  ORF Transcript_26181/g.38988 Transcript_26181/m.38988 type:complete len:694 (-) Transcript_26181:406-2487(-)|eukprot:CAMPEP_0116014244 /NCGR_PEP_ID=MMETSP0321-20121206/6171_1 /TAXON_ID=163516 /ORGANISM="Leptocylindrus danicus var. danicus, Strain B650" /LENGTH=693 /DNA_ID=CAMNT_0003483877 /DNA_START=44 /DNA_END=2125 /DNA_ORIENTATION=-
MEALETVVEKQISSLDDTDDLASVWNDALIKWKNDPNGKISWGGRGKGGRGLARSHYHNTQPNDIVVPNVYLEYISTHARSKNKVLLDGTSTLKLLNNRVYALVGRNGTGKSTLLRRIHSGKIPGFPPQISTNYVPQEVLVAHNADNSDEEESSSSNQKQTAFDVLMKGQADVYARQIKNLETELDEMDMDAEGAEDRMELLCEQISSLEESASGIGRIEIQAVEALRHFSLDHVQNVPICELSGGQRKKVYLASALFSLSSTDLLCLDEPTNHVDVAGILQLRKLLELAHEHGTTVLLVSHDVDLINDCATDVINLVNGKLDYYNGNYCDYLIAKQQLEIHLAKQQHVLEKQRAHMISTIDNLKKQKSGKCGKQAKKCNNAISSRKKKLERHGIMKNENGHRWTVQNAGTGIRQGSINSIDASTRRRMTYAQLLKRNETNVAMIPDKAVQFKFRESSCTWGETLIRAMDVGYGYESNGDKQNERLIFDNVDLCVEESSRIFILGPNGCGKSTLLKLLAGVIDPLEGSIQRASNVKVAFFSQHIADEMIERFIKPSSSPTNAVSLIMDLYPHKSEVVARADLNAFGLGPEQVFTDIAFLSGGERCRLCLTALFMDDLQPPDVLILDEVTNHLDVESVEALAYGLKQWNGAVVMVSHDANLVRTIGGTCLVFLEEKGKLCRVEGGIDVYLKSFR